MRKATTNWWAQAVQNRLIAMVLAMVAFVPLVAAPANSRMTGIAALAVEAFAIVLLATLLWRVRWDLRRESVVKFLRTGANLPVLLFLGLAVLSCVLSPQKGVSIQETLRLGAGVLLYFVVAYQFRRSEYLSKLVDTLLFVAIAASVVGFTQYGISPEQRATGLFGEPQLFASFLMILLPLVAVVAVTEKAVNRQLAAQVATVLTTACILLTHTRSAWVGAAAGMAMLGVLATSAALRNGKLAARKHEVVLPVMLLVVAAGLFMLLTPQANSILTRMSTLSQVDRVGSWHERQVMQQGALKMVEGNPLTGVGIGRYPYLAEQYGGKGRTLAAGLTRPSLLEQAHNLYFQTAAELGIPGLLLLAGILVTFLAAGLRRVFSMDAGIRRNLLIGSMASVVAVAVDGIASPSWQLGQNSMFLWLMLGVGVGCMRPAARHREEVVEAPVTARIKRPAVVVAALALAVLLPTVVFAVDGGYPDHVVISPKSLAVHGGKIVQYTLTLVFSDGSTADVSTDPGTTFSEVGGAGAMVGTNNRYYQSKWGENDLVTVTGTYTNGSFTDSDDAELTVGP